MLLLWIGQRGGCMIVDSTRKGKRFPDSMSKTIPIWTCVLNRAILNYRDKMNGINKPMEGVSSFLYFYHDYHIWCIFRSDMIMLIQVSQIK